MRATQTPQVRRAVLRLMRVVSYDHVERHSPQWWDIYTAGCDARTALCIARGVPLDLIGPACGTGPWPAPVAAALDVPS
jgi:hypothetical protein